MPLANCANYEQLLRISLTRMDLKADIRRHVMATLPHDPSDTDATSELASMDIGRLLVTYHNWLSRLIRPVARSVHLSKAYQANPMRAQFSAPLRDILSSLERGRDLTPRLSKDVALGYVAGSRSTSRDKDLLLNDWGVHHLHLGTGPDQNNPNFIARTDELLLVMLLSNTAYVIDIFAHKQWTSRAIVRAAIDSWPNVELFPQVKGVLPSRNGYTEAEHLKLRKSGILTSVDIDGQVYIGRGFLSTAGTSSSSQRAADLLLDQVEDFEDQWKQAPDSIRAMIAAKGDVCPNTPDFEFIFTETTHGVLEKVSGTLLQFAS